MIVMFSVEDGGDSCVIVVMMPCIVGGDLKLGASGCPGLHVAQHGLKPLHARGMSVGQLVRQATVQTERLQFEPDETKTVLIEQHEEPRGALRTCKAMPSN